MSMCLPPPLASPHNLFTTSTPKNLMVRLWEIEIPFQLKAPFHSCHLQWPGQGTDLISPSKCNQFLEVHLWVLGCIGTALLLAGMNRNGVTGMHTLLVGRQKDKSCFGEQSGNIWHDPAHITVWTKCARK